MAEFITIEPANEHRSAFARWALDQDPNVQTVGTHGFVVPLDWYPDVPAALLVGSFVDGFAYDRSAPQPEVLAAETGDPKDEDPPADRKPLAAEQKQSEAPKRTPRKRAPRKPKADDAG